MQRKWIGAVFLSLLLAAFIAQGLIPSGKILPALDRVLDSGKESSFKHTEKLFRATDSSDLNGAVGKKTVAFKYETLHLILEDLNPDTRRKALVEFAKTATKSNPSEAWLLLRDVKGLADRQIFACSIVEEWAKRSPTETLKSIAGLPPGELQIQSYGVAIGAWARSAPTNAINFANEKLEGPSRQLAVGMAASEWARQDPTAAANWALINSNSPSGISAIAEVMEFWGDTNPEAGAAWASSLPESSFRRQAVQAILSTWADQFPEEAAAWVSRVAATEDSVALLSSVWAKSDPSAAMSWASALPEGRIRESARREALAAWSTTAPRQALDWIESQPGKDSREMILQTLYAWGAIDPLAAYEWARTQPGADVLTQPVLQSWSVQNSQAFMEWSNAVPPATRSDGMLELMSATVAETVPLIALQHASKIREELRKTEAIERVLGVWEQANPVEAKKWRLKNNMPPISL